MRYGVWGMGMATIQHPEKMQGAVFLIYPLCATLLPSLIFLCGKKNHFNNIIFLVTIFSKISA